MPSNPAIRVSGLSKRYRIGMNTDGRRYTALRDVLAALPGRIRRTLTGRRPQGHNPESDPQDFWALKDVNFEITQGEVVGIIGRNGAGKSTLLKVLSRITEPTVGRVEIRGRVASLLEVGTGFHPELTGRENIYLNGAILGMSRAEIRSKFDEIVAFAEVEKFLDTPVKRYSSGMYVRLAFAVAAHLEPEILIVDEVLAVGDAEFQKKCLGKMKDVAGHGRTVLFVSHNMAAVSSLTEKAIVLDRGRTAFHGPTVEAVNAYAQLSGASRSARADGALGRGRHSAILEACLIDEAGSATSQYAPGTPLRIELGFETDGSRGLSVDFLLVDQNKAKIALGSGSHFGGCELPTVAGRYRMILDLAPAFLASGQYSIDLTTSVVNHGWDHYVEDAIPFEVLFSNPAGLPFNFASSQGYGAFALPFASPPRIERLESQAAAAE